MVWGKNNFWKLTLNLLRELQYSNPPITPHKQQKPNRADIQTSQKSGLGLLFVFVLIM